MQGSSSQHPPLLAPPSDASAEEVVRYRQMFPVLSGVQLQRLNRYGTRLWFRPGEFLNRVGEMSRGVQFIISGQVAVQQRDGLGRITPIVTMPAGAFLGELGQLCGAPALVDSYAIDDVQSLALNAQQLRGLLVAEAELGETLMRALVLRRKGLIDAGQSGPVLVQIGLSAIASPHLERLREFLGRNSQPYGEACAAQDAAIEALAAERRAGDGDVLVLCPGGETLLNPRNEQIAHVLGMSGDADCAEFYDVAIIGAGPAGLSCSVYAASEGLRVAVLEREALGGQAGASARIENYFGFPAGVSGRHLVQQADAQARKFGARVMVPARAVGLRCASEPVRGDRPLSTDVELEDGRVLRARSVVVACGARYRKPQLAGLEDFEGRGVSYWVSPEDTCSGEDVVVLGGGNSAGQAAVFLASHCRRVTMLVRGKQLATSMSRYLVDRIAALSNIDVQSNAELAALVGDARRQLALVKWRDRLRNVEHAIETRRLFIFIGAVPETSCLDGCGVLLDAKGFVRTGTEIDPLGESYRRGPLETSRAGVFAIGDIRSGSVKRVGSAIGEGAAVVAQLHHYLALAN